MIFVEWQARNMSTMVERRAAMVPSRLSVNNIEFWMRIVYLPVGRGDGVVYECGRGDRAVDEQVEPAQQEDRHQTWTEPVFCQTPTGYDIIEAFLW